MPIFITAEYNPHNQGLGHCSCQMNDIANTSHSHFYIPMSDPAMISITYSNFTYRTWGWVVQETGSWYLNLQHGVQTGCSPHSVITRSTTTSRLFKVHYRKKIEHNRQRKNIKTLKQLNDTMMNFQKCSMDFSSCLTWLTCLPFGSLNQTWQTWHVSLHTTSTAVNPSNVPIWKAFRRGYSLLSNTI